MQIAIYNERMETFVIYNVARRKRRGLKRGKKPSLNFILGLRPVADENLIPAILNSGIAIVDGTTPLLPRHVLDRVLAERGIT
jgi:hypothetical protein